MTRDEWTSLHRAARSRRQVDVGQCFLMRDEDGRLGVTRRHDKGHLIPPAAIANVLRHAARWRHIRSDHAIYLDRVRQLRRRGTWL